MDSTGLATGSTMPLKPGKGHEARGKSYISDQKLSPLATSHLPLAKKLAIAAELLMNNAG